MLIDSGIITSSLQVTGSYIQIGNATISGSLNAYSVTSSLLGTASWANNATTASYIATASWANNATTASFVATSSWATNALTASSADNFTVRGTLTAQTIVTQVITSSVDFVTGSTRFGSSSASTHQFTGSVSMTGSLTVTGNGITSSLFGTSSWATSSITASYIATASWANNATTSSYIATSSWANNATSASYSLTASYALNASSTNPFPYTGSAGISGSLELSGSYIQTGSHVISGSLFVQSQNVSDGYPFVLQGKPDYNLWIKAQHFGTGSGNGTGIRLLNGHGLSFQMFTAPDASPYVLGGTLIQAVTKSLYIHADSGNINFSTVGYGILDNSYYRLVINNSTGNVIIGNNGIDGGNKLQIGGNVSASLAVTASAFTGSIVSAPQITGSLFGTASWATSASSAVSSSYALSASWAPGGGLSGGTSNYIPLWTGANTLSSSAIYQNAGNIGINTTASAYKLEVSGTAAFTDGIIATGSSQIQSGSLTFNSASIIFSPRTDGIQELMFWSGSTNLLTIYTGSIPSSPYIQHLYLYSKHYNPSLLSGDYANIAIGSKALQSASFGRNLSIGASSLSSLGVGQSNIAIGIWAGEYMTTGSGNIFLGSEAGGSVSGSGNIMIGANTAWHLQQTTLREINNCIGIGTTTLRFDGAGPFTPLSNTIAIGNLIQTDLSNVVIIGRVSGDPQNVIIGRVTNNTGDKFQVEGSTNLNGNLGVTGSFNLLGNQQITGSLNAPNITGSLLGTASWATNALTASYMAALGALNGLSSISQSIVTGSSGGDFNISSTNATHSFNLPDASATARGLVTTGTQTFAGIKTFNAAARFPANATFELTSGNLYYTAASNYTVGDTAPRRVFPGSTNTDFRVALGGSNYSGAPTANGNIISVILTTGNQPTGLSGIHPIMATAGIKSFTTNSNGANVDTATSLYIEGEPTGAINTYALLVDSGSSRFDGNILITTGSLVGTASFATSASVAISSSYVLSSSYALSSSYVLSSSNALSSSYVLSASNAQTSSWAIAALTASSADNFTVRNSLTMSAFTNGSILFATASGAITQNNSSLYWDNNNKRLGINITPTTTFQVLRGVAGAMAKNAYESVAFEYDGDHKLGIYTSTTNPATAGASLLLGFSNYTVGTRYLGYEMQMVGSSSLSENNLRFNFVGRDSTGVVVSASVDYLKIYQDGRVHINGTNAGYNVTPKLIIGSLIDSGDRLQVSGSARIAGNTTITGSLIASGSTHTITGSLNVSGSITGSLFGTSSWANNATSASYILTASFANNSTSASYSLSSSYALSASWAPSAAGGTPGGSTTQIQYNNGGLFGGVPVLTYDGTTLRGTGSLSGSFTGSIATPSIVIGTASLSSTSSLTAAVGNVISSIPTGSYNSAFYNYYLAAGGNVRAGYITVAWSGSTVRYSEFATVDMGNTATASFTASISGQNIQLILSGSSGWTVRTMATLL